MFASYQMCPSTMTYHSLKRKNTPEQVSLIFTNAEKSRNFGKKITHRRSVLRLHGERYVFEYRISTVDQFPFEATYFRDLYFKISL